MATKPTPAKATPKATATKTTAAPKATAKKPAAVAVEVKKTSLKEAPEKKAKVTEEAPKKKPVPKPKKEINLSEMKTTAPKDKTTTTAQASKTAYHVSKRDNDGREWKVFIQGSTKVIKLFDTQAEALKYAQNLCKNKDDGSYVLLHGLDGKIRKF